MTPEPGSFVNEDQLIGIWPEDWTTLGSLKRRPKPHPETPARARHVWNKTWEATRLLVISKESITSKNWNKHSQNRCTGPCFCFIEDGLLPIRQNHAHHNLNRVLASVETFCGSGPKEPTMAAFMFCVWYPQVVCLMCSYTTGNLSFWLFNILFESWRNKMKQTYLKLPLLRYNYIIPLWLFVIFLCAECKKPRVFHDSPSSRRFVETRLRQRLLRHRHRGGAGHFAQPAMGHGSGLWGAPFRTPPRTPKLGSECLFFLGGNSWLKFLFFCLLERLVKWNGGDEIDAGMLII